MDGFDHPLTADVRTEAAPEREPLFRLEDARRYATDPIIWLSALGLAVFALDFILHEACGATEDFCAAPGRTVLSGVVLMHLVLGGLALRAAFSRYFLLPTQLLAIVVAALPLAHFLAADHDGRAAEMVLPPPTDLSSIELALAEATAQTLLLEDRIAELDAERARLAMPGTPLPSIEDVREIAAEEAARIAAEEEAALNERLVTTEAEMIEAIEARQRRSAALASVGQRIAAAGPLLRPTGEEGPPPLPAEIAEVADRMALSEADRRRLATDGDARTCISTRLAERGPLAALNQRLNPDRLASYLAVCFDE
ncbi:hypothetical protein [Parvularcula maris]|uniref:Uncharacterized protein n=1 Tax=Parvularcula maris TaxID=2965077 RepID=A0A9X2L831_9PROT|nr:hypothetical protein [Parvularcula maris]MCQ8184834.1 hypothetical protein [Parvularcula maris]